MSDAITKADLENFKIELLEEIKKILPGATEPPRKWLKSREVRDLLNISPGTLQNMRLNGTLPFTKIGGLTFYSNDDIIKLMESNKVMTKNYY